MKFSDELKMLRINKGMTQYELADAIGLKRSAISMYESGKREPDFETAEMFADFFNVNMDRLMGRHMEPVPTPSPANSPQEEKLLTDFRSLSHSGQHDVLRYVRMLKQDEEEHAQKDAKNFG